MIPRYSIWHNRSSPCRCPLKQHSESTIISYLIYYCTENYRKTEHSYIVMQLQRQSNIELLMIFAIIMVVMEHFIRQSSLLASATEANGIINAFLGSGGRIAVNIFLLIGSWFMVDTTIRPIKASILGVGISVLITASLLTFQEQNCLLQSNAGLRKVM